MSVKISSDYWDVEHRLRRAVMEFRGRVLRQFDYLYRNNSAALKGLNARRLEALRKALANVDIEFEEDKMLRAIIFRCQVVCPFLGEPITGDVRLEHEQFVRAHNTDMLVDARAMELSEKIAELIFKRAEYMLDGTIEDYTQFLREVKNDSPRNLEES